MYELRIYGYTGVERHCEVEYLKEDVLIKSFQVEDLKTTISMDRDGRGNVRIENIRCIEYDEDNNPIPIILSQYEIDRLEYELAAYVDWNEWLDDQRPDDDDYEERKFNSMD